jgi:transglutaminase-like putative cysteine protease
MVPLVVETANGIVSMVASRDYYAMALAIREWLTRNFKFVPDPVGGELLRDPEYQLREYLARGQITGDCDDAAVLGAALGKAVGIRAKFVAVGFRNPGPLAHVFAVLTGPVGRAIGSGGIGVDLDVTKPVGSQARIRRAIQRNV